MKQIQLIKKDSIILYYKDGELVSNKITASEKLYLAMYGETRIMNTETVIERWYVKNNKESELMFWKYMNENNIIDSSSYYIVFTN